MTDGKPGFDAALSEAQSALKSLERINGNIPSAGFIVFWLGVVPAAGFLAILISF